MENWDLQAVVRGYIDDFDTSSVFEPMSVPQETLNFPEPRIDELEDLFKPFYPNSNIPFSISVPHQDVEVPPEKMQQSSVVAPKSSRKRKNQQNRVVQHVTADGLLSDTWAWRKYGQKPIKGSPYPRSYYRCSSSKGCLARKQLERCYYDPQIFIITYTAEHNHDQPTRRSSLAGTTRNKPCEAQRRAFYESLHVPTGPVTTPENHFMNHETIKREEEVVEDFEGNTIFGQDLMSNDEFLRNLEDLEGILMGQIPI